MKCFFLSQAYKGVAYTFSAQSAQEDTNLLITHTNILTHKHLVYATLLCTLVRFYGKKHTLCYVIKRNYPVAVQIPIGNVCL